MSPLYPKTIIVRHNRENLRKCSLSGLEARVDCEFFCYPNCTKTGIGDISRYCLLDFDGPALSKEDAGLGIVLLDATWRYAEKMKRLIPDVVTLPKRSLPSLLRTAYPRRQEDCSDQTRGLASIEALYAAYVLLGRPTDGLLDHYHWGQQFLDNNKCILTSE